MMNPEICEPTKDKRKYVASVKKTGCRAENHESLLWLTTDFHSKRSTLRLRRRYYFLTEKKLN